MQHTDSNRFPNARSPLCAVPVNADNPDSRAACAADTIRNACNLLDVLSHAYEDSDEHAAQFMLLHTVQFALSHALQLLEEGRAATA